MPSRLSQRRRTFVVAVTAAGLALGGAGVVALVRADGPGSAPVVRPSMTATSGAAAGAPSEPPPEVPVVLVHGFGGSTEDMTTIGARLRADGRATVSVTLPGNGTVDIAESVREVDRAVRAADADVVDLVGYSLGGVVVRAWVRSGSDAAEARRVVTVASPHHGAQLAETAAAFDPARCVGACAQLRPRSQFLRELNGGDETPGTASWTTIWTSFDQTVTPPESATLEGAVNVQVQAVCADTRIGHGSINRDPLPLGLVVLALRGDLRAPPPRSQCTTVRDLGA